MPPPAVLSQVKDVLRDGRPKAARPDLSRALTVPLNGGPHKLLVTVVPIPEYLPRRAGAAIVLEDVTELRREVIAVASLNGLSAQSARSR